MIDPSCMSGGMMMWGMAIAGLLIAVLLLFAIAALGKYLFRGKH
ncbi:MAG: hypothetical protein V7723_17910 [Sneathiella sp.]